MEKINKVKECKTLISKTIGLMFSKKKNLVFIFPEEQRISLHMLFVFFPIWALYLNEKKQLVFMKKLYPFISTSYPKVKAKYIMELIELPNVKIGDILDW